MTASGTGTPTRRETRATARRIFSVKSDELSTMYRCSWPVQQSRVRGPSPRLLGRLEAHRVVGVRVELLGAVGGGHHVQHGVVPRVAHHHRRQVELVEQQLPLRVGHVRLAVHQPAVEEDDARPPRRLRLRGELVLERDLHLEQPLLEVEARRLVRRVRDPAGEEQRRRLGTQSTRKPSASSRVLSSVSRRLAAARPTGEHHLVHRRQRRHARAAAPDVGESRPTRSAAAAAAAAARSRLSVGVLACFRSRDASDERAASAAAAPAATKHGRHT